MSQNAIQVIRTPKQAKEWLRRQGYTIRSFCRRHGVAAQSGYDVLNERVAGNHGDAHKVAIALGIKPDPENPMPIVTPDELAVLEKLQEAGRLRLEGPDEKGVVYITDEVS